MSKKVGIARAHTNIALIKYWGKRDRDLFLPMNSSLSLTLEAFYTDTKVIFDDSLIADVFYLNKEIQSEKEIEKISQFLDLFREYTGEKRFACVESLNFVPTAAGLASSASAFAALALATSTALGLEMSREQLSTFARRGSGSSTRSLFGGFVEWDMGTNSADSIARPIDAATWDIGMIILAVDTGKKKIASRAGMEHTVQTSPFYPMWVETAAQDLQDIKLAIAQHDFERVGQIAEHNGMKMHATTLSANPPFTYWTADTIRAQEAVRQVREDLGAPAYMTMDAGPNVKVLCRASDMERLVVALKEHLPAEQVLTSLSGPGAYTLSEADWQGSQAAFSRGVDHA
ncbi:MULTISPECIES: diphosphomevalonate decarboxylase [unclassified Streptococcus]|uniref:diphosphomevalonate decarboxylase n=1 Tax=unclassified Streptococcus TaxID=2608887 RepID=UPI0010726D5C|nr:MULTISPECIES: diphosphomevalonate decarboxylase [unclassified Streptococcus]MBF0788265.1 diphosphomevalonate decarboxylase [Streptococcus sp. 19428wC2_LYSM12]MCQ9211793.1 diphosphomevalonate decarboxylase [Streptococcus sp. B01]MCQ9212913.1 diphosphomevalonate decarboxylase [Streptococcus sp. O1]TFV04660.1 diphosphomevalonate decarboxylase [Streptococcus sp. LYSM12]